MPSSKGFHQLAAVFRGATGRSVAVIAVILTCVLAANAFGQFKHSQTIAPVAGNPERYEIATALYARLATLPQPVSVSDVARLLNNFIQDDSLVAGATLVDTRNQLMVQVGAGNESLALDTLPVNSGHVPTAKIPVTSEGQPFATVVVTFKRTQRRIIHMAAIFCGRHCHTHDSGFCLYRIASLWTAQRASPKVVVR